MKINKNSLQSRIKSIVDKKCIPSNTVLQQFFFESFLKRLASSKFSSNYILKGGFLLSNNFGINYRSTMDMDFLLKNVSLKIETIKEMIEEICLIDVNDLVTFKLVDIDDIRDNDRYGGLKITLLGQLENIKNNVYIDIVTGDPITPKAINYSYKCLFDNEILNIQSYNFETILAEKIQTILSRSIFNSRCKDFYDVYIIEKLQLENIKNINLIKAYNNTCNYRNTIYTKEEATKIINELIKNNIILNRWNNYKTKNLFAYDIEFKDTIFSIQKLISIIYKEN